MAKKIKQFKKDVDKIPRLYQHKPKRVFTIKIFTLDSPGASFTIRKPTEDELEQAFVSPLALVHANLGRYQMVMTDKRMCKNFLKGEYDNWMTRKTIFDW